MAELVKLGARLDPAFAAELVDRFGGGGDQRAELVGLTARAWAATDPDAGLAWADGLEGDLRDRALAQIADQFVGSAPDAGETVAGRISDPRARSGFMEKAAQLRVSAGVGDALAWISTLDPGDQAAAWRGAAQQWSRLDPALAAGFAAATDDPVARRALADEAASAWARLEPDAAAAWARGLPGDVQGSALGRVLARWSESDPAAAATSAGQIEDPEVRGNLLRKVVGHWARSDPAAAASWVTSGQAADPVSIANYREVASHWTRSDPAAASAWTASLPDGPGRDAAVASLASNVAADDPVGAAAWADTISNPKLRDDSLRSVARQFAKEAR
jgi:hypothetical protein